MRSFKIKSCINIIDRVKETQQERKERVNSAGSAMFTHIVKDKTKFDKKKQRQLDKNKKYDI